MPRFNLYTHNSLECLAQAYCDAWQDKPGQFRILDDIFIPESITVATRGMGIWLEQYLVRHRRVAANIKFPFVRDTIDHILSAFFANEPNYRPELFSEQVLTWRLYDFLTHDSLNDFPVLKQYFNPAVNPDQCIELRRFQLSAKLASLLFDYQSFLPDKLHLPQARALVPQNLRWQLDLWDRLCVVDGQPLLSPAEAVIRFLEMPDAAIRAAVKNFPTQLPPVTFFGISAMPPMFLKILKKLSCAVDVNFFYHNPCDEYWADQRSKWEASRQQVAEPEDFDNLFDNTLLGNFGIQGREFFKAVLDLDIQDIPIEYDRSWQSLSSEAETKQYQEDTPSLLSEIQQRVISRSNPDEDEQLPLPDWDDSLTIHSCFNATRELETLQDALLHLIDTHHYAMNDIIVMAPDIAEFAPAIQAVFDNGPLKGHYAVTDRSIKNANLIAASFLSIFSLCQTDFEVSQISRLLDSTPLQHRFGLTEDDTATIRQWLLTSNIRWGKDAKDRLAKCGFAFDEFSWRHGLDRLLLNLAIDPSANTSTDDATATNFNGLVPIPFASSEEHLHGLESLLKFFESLSHYADEFTTIRPQGRTAAEWQELLIAMRSDFFLPDKDSAADYAALGQAFQNFKDSMEAAGCQELPIPYPVVRALLAATLERPAPGEAFLNGKITFCSLLPMRGIPCKVIAMLGMDEAKFPRNDEKLGFNLMRNANLISGYSHSRSMEDRYTFLEAILAARDYLMIFYRGKDDKSLDKLLPAAPVAELLDYAARLRNLSPDGNSKTNAIVMEHRLNAFDAKNFRQQTSSPSTGWLRSAFSYDATNADIVMQPQSVAQLSPLTDLGKGLFQLPLPSPLPFQPVGGELHIRLDDLIRFYRNPIQRFFIARLGFPRFMWDTPDFTDYEPFMQDYIEQAVQKRQLSRLQAGLASPTELFPSSDSTSDVATPFQPLFDNWKATSRLPVQPLARNAFLNEQIAAWIDDETIRNALNSMQETDFEVVLDNVPMDLPETLQSKLLSAVGYPVQTKLLPMEKVRITGRFPVTPEGGIVSPVLSTENAKHLIEPYIRYLLVHSKINHPAPMTVCFKEKNRSLESDEIENPQDKLAKLVTLYMVGHLIPLPLFQDYSPQPKKLTYCSPDRCFQLIFKDFESLQNDQTWLATCEEFAKYAFSPLGNLN
ncbi:MAG: exodeoxyribonuclease V subunit gamma [Victivallales bacterium]|nr:exodeoxyribonuclease V subunit gamma [Victivallales bacterium]